MAKVGQMFLAKVGLAKVGIGQSRPMRMAKVELAKVGISQREKERGPNFCLVPLEEGHAAVGRRAMEEHVWELTHWLGDLEYSNAERLSPAFDGDIGGKELMGEQFVLASSADRDRHECEVEEDGYALCEKDATTRGARVDWRDGRQ